MKDGTTEVQEVKRSLKHYVQHIPCANLKPGFPTFPRAWTILLIIGQALAISYPVCQ